MDLLSLAQIIFYFVFSFFLIVLGILLSVMVYYIIRFVVSLFRISNNIGNATEEMRGNITEMFDRLSQIPILSLFIKKHETKKAHKKTTKK